MLVPRQRQKIKFLICITKGMKIGVKLTAVGIGLVTVVVAVVLAVAHQRPGHALVLAVAGELVPRAHNS